MSNKEEVYDAYGSTFEGESELSKVTINAAELTMLMTTEDGKKVEVTFNMDDYCSVRNIQVTETKGD